MEELLSLKWNNHRSTFIHILGVLRDKQLYTDATLACDGKFYSVHKLVMSTCSDYFSAMFDKTVCKNPIIVLKDIKSEDLEALLDYMYLGEVNVKQSDLASLIKSAECLRIKGLAVPDDEPPKKPISVNKGDSSHSSSSSSINNKKSDSVLGSPPSKRRRRDEVDDGRDDVRPAHVSVKQQPTTPRPKTPPIIAQQRHSSPIPQKPIIQSPEIVRPSSPSIRQPLDTPSQSTAQADSGSNQFGTENASLVKVEMDDTGGDDMQAETYDLTNDGYKEENDDTADLSNDLPEFLQAASGSLQGSFPHSSFAGPSAYQPGDLAGWQGDGANITFPSHLNYSSSESSSQPNAPGGGLGYSTLFTSIQDAYKGVHLLSSTSTPSKQVYNQLLDTADQSRKAMDKQSGSCNICGHTFSGPTWKQKLERHVLIHTGEKPFKCPLCLHCTNRKDALKMHIASVHSFAKINTSCMQD